MCARSLIDTLTIYVKMKAQNIGRFVLFKLITPNI